MKTQKLAYISLFAALMGVLGLFPAIPLGFTPVPITPQSLGVILTGSILGARLGPKYAAYSQMLFLLLVAMGLPLLSGGRGGFGVFLAPSGGYLIGYIVGAYVIGYLCYRMKEAKLFKLIVVNVFGGMVVVYLFGIPFQAMMMNISFWEAFIINLAFLPGDFTKVIIGSIFAIKLQKTIPHLKEETKAA